VKVGRPDVWSQQCPPGPLHHWPTDHRLASLGMADKKGRIEPGEDENLEIAIRLPVGKGAVEIEFAELHMAGERQAVTGIGPAGHYAGEELSDGGIRFAARGRAPQGEEDSRPVSRILIQHLRTLGEDWSEPERENLSDVDCRATWGKRELRIQVTKADAEPEFWRALRGRVEAKNLYTSADGAADGLRSVIQKKAQTDTQGTTLVLNATQTPGLAMPSVVDSFRSRHGAWASDLGFERVWIVGPHEGFIHRLDVAP